MTEKKKLIEVALPLEAINAASAREKSIRHGHPSTLHLWWARRPLAAARAVIWSSLVDDPSSHPEEFPTEEDQERERQRLFRILEDLVVWENSNDERVLAAAKAEIMKSTDGNPPALLDPFAGGGAIPLEAQRLGLEAHASDLNPVAVMINKAMIEIPPKFAGCNPVNPEARKTQALSSWTGAQGLAEDVRYYGEWMKQEAFKRIGHLYPKVKVAAEQGGGEATVIAWIWARTVKCPNPACGCEMPLAKSFILSKKKGHEAYVIPHYSHGRFEYTVHNGKGEAPEAPKTSRGANFKCLACGSLAGDEYVKQEALAGRMRSQLLAVVAEGPHGRLFIAPDDEQENAANTQKPSSYPSEKLAYDPRNIWCSNYGLDTFDKLFTNRQLTALTTFSDLVAVAQKKAQEDAVAAGMADDGIGIADGGTGAKAYGEAVGVYLAFLIDQLANHCSSICSWHTRNTQLRNTFSRQAIPMVWDYAESNPFSCSTGSYNNLIERMVKAFTGLPKTTHRGIANQLDAQSDIGICGIMVSTDPPYYDNIGYADLSDYFYIWMRRSLKNTYPDLFRTMLVPKAEELVATPYRFDGGADEAKSFFEDGMLKVCERFYDYSRDDVPVTIYYAFKQREDDSDEEDEKVASSGWETMLSAIIKAGFAITGTWPMRTEMSNRSIASGTNALASSIVLVCRKRSENAPICTRRDFVNTLRREMKPALKHLQESNIAPVDLAQSAIGPGMGVYSCYSKVIEADGSTMDVRSALQIINQELDLYFTEQEGDLDRESRFCVEFYTQYAFNDMKFGDADVLARAKNTSVAKMADDGALYAKRGIVHLATREELSGEESASSMLWVFTQRLVRSMETGGVESCAQMLQGAFGASKGERAKSLAYRLFTIADKKGWAQEAYTYNNLVIAWPEISMRAADIRRTAPVQTSMFDATSD